MLGTAIVVLLPTFFVLAPGYAAGHAKQLNADQSLGAVALWEMVGCLFPEVSETPSAFAEDVLSYHFK